MPNGVNANAVELLDIQPLMDFHLEWTIHHPKMEADHPHHMKVGAIYEEQESKFHHGIKQLPSRVLGAR